MNGRYNEVDVSSIVKNTNTPPQTAPAVQASVPYKAAPKENWDARAQYWSDKEKRDIEVVEPRINYASSRKDAIAAVGIAIAHDAIVFGNANKGARLGIILDAIDEVTDRYFQKSMAFGKPVDLTDKPEAEEAPATFTD